MADFLAFIDVSFGYDGARAEVLSGLTAQFPRGWTGIVGANGVGKTTLLRLASGLLRPTRGSVRLPGPGYYCSQRTDEAPVKACDFMDAADDAACGLRGRLLIDPSWIGRWPSLSHGERKRVQIAVALWRNPVVLALDEPTNHLDAATRRLLIEVLRLWPGVGLLVSHDRELLDALCGQCLVMEPANSVMRPGGYTQSAALARADAERARKAYAQARHELRRMERMFADRRRKADEARAKYSKRKLDPGDRDGKGRIDLARLSGKDGQAGRLLGQISSRLDRARADAKRLQVSKQKKLGVELAGERARRDRLLFLPAGSIGLGENRLLEYPDLCVMPDDRIGLVGPNGSGKSCFIRHLLARLSLPPENMIYLAQEIGREEAIGILKEIRGLDRSRLGEVMTCFCRLGSDPQRLLGTDDPSPGELRKMLLALGITRRPQLIVMDEPTNHMDLPSVECLEDALDACGCAMILVSHDRVFLKRLVHDFWRIDPESKTRSLLSLGRPDE